MTTLSGAAIQRPSTGRRAEPSLITRCIVWSLALSAGIHLAVAYQHGVTGDHGRFFAAVGMAQALLAVLISRRSSRRRLWAVTALSVFVVGTWVAVKTSLFPAITGPPTPAGLVDTGATVLEGMAIAAALVLLRRSRLPSPAMPNVAAVLALVALPALGLVTLGDAHDAHHEHPGDQPVQATPPATTLSVFGDLFDDHHAGPTDHEPEAPAHPHEPGTPAHPN